jgi:thymidine phosphorylase
LRAVDVVQKKRDGGELTREEIDFFVRGYARGEIPDYQASAFTMAVFFRGMAPGNQDFGYEVNARRADFRLCLSAEIP